MRISSCPSSSSRCTRTPFENSSVAGSAGKTCPPMGKDDGCDSENVISGSSRGTASDKRRVK
eukprot:4618150-Amphidinium_carterae.1